MSLVALENVFEGYLKGVWVFEVVNNDNECICIYKINNFIYYILNLDFYIFKVVLKIIL